VQRRSIRGWVRDNSLALATVGIFLMVWLGGQTTAGYRVYNEDQQAHGQPTIGFAEYLTTAHFGEATFENWESEFLQMGAYVVLTVRLRQRGSAESKPLDGEQDVDADPKAHRSDPDAPWPVRHGGLPLAIYKRSLSITFFVLFGLAFLFHAITGAAAFNEEQVVHGEPTVSVIGYLHRAQFWFESLQNWQSEFLAVAAIVLLTIFLRQQGSPESKPVHAAHSTTGS
jgi:hypothetical protein